MNCCALLIATISLLLSFGSQQPAPSDFYPRGKADLESKNYLKAEQEFDQAEHQSPGTTNALALRSKALINLTRYEEAEHCLRLYLKVSPHSADATYLLAYVLFRRDRPRESLAQYTEAAKLRRPTADDFKIVGLNYVLLDDNTDALKWLERSVAEAPNNPEAVYFLGRAYYVENSFDKAMAAFELALRLDPRNVKAENGMGLVYAAKNRTDLAEAAYRKAIQIEEQSGNRNQEPYLNLADLLSRGGHDDEVLRLLDAAEQIGGKSDRSQEIRGRIYLSENRLHDAESEFRAALALKPKNGSLHYLLGRVLKREGKTEDAEKEFAQTRALLGPQVEALKRAAALIAQHDLVSSETTLQDLLKTTPDDAVAINLLGVVRMEQQTPDEAEKLFRQALSINPNIAGPHLNLARLYSRTRPLDSIAELKQALSIAPQDEQARSLLHNVAKQASLKALQSGEKQKALEILLRAREAEPHDPELLYEFGMVEKETGLRKDAQSAFEEALRIRPDYGDAIYALARVYLDENMAKSAEEEMRKYLSLKPDDATAQYGLGFILVAEEKLGEAKAAFEKSLALQPNQTESVFELGRIAQQTGNDGVAGEDFRKVLARDPHHAGALTEIGAMEYRAADYAGARSNLEMAIVSAPDFQKAHYFYALTLRKLGEKDAADRQFEISRSLQKTHTTEPRLTADQQ